VKIVVLVSVNRQRLTLRIETWELVPIPIGGRRSTLRSALAHRYWEYPAAQVTAQYNNFLKNLAIFGGALVLFVTGAGRFSVDRMLSKKG
jgi:hypothetical protein